MIQEEETMRKLVGLMSAALLMAGAASFSQETKARVYTLGVTGAV
jgi:hypothetical protein